MSNQAQSQWMRLDNAAKIYPAARRRNWTALFRLSATLSHPVEPETLRAALARVIPRFPSFAVRLRSGLFWYYLERNPGVPPIREDGCCPCLPLRPEDNDGFLLRVLYYDCRIAVEFFHVLSDGTGGLCFLKTLLAEYLTLQYGIDVPRSGDILDCTVPPQPEELEDSFLRYADGPSASRRESAAFRIRGWREPDGFIHLTCGVIHADVLLARAREKGVSVTQYLAAVLILAIDAVQRREVRLDRLQRPVRICLPVNLRAFFPSRTLRNFSSFVNAGIDPRLGEHSLDEALQAVHHYMGSEVTEKHLRARFTANVRSERNTLLRLMPLFLKNPVMKMAFRAAGDNTSSSTITNLGRVQLPVSMRPYVPRMELILGPLSFNPIACSAMSYDNLLYMNITRTITDPKVEREFFTRLVKLGIPVRIESNGRPEPPAEEKSCPTV